MTTIPDPDRMTEPELRAWLGSCDNRALMLVYSDHAPIISPADDKRNRNRRIVEDEVRNRGLIAGPKRS